MNAIKPDHVDEAVIHVAGDALGAADASAVLALLLEGFIQRPPARMRHWMRLRNCLVKPWKLRTSEMACPVSPLLASDAPQYFAGRFPVQHVLADAPDHAEIVLAVDDWHLRFRTHVAVKASAAGGWRVSMMTSVQTLNHFGRLYMTVVDPVHRHCVAPMILRHALDYAVDRLSDGRGKAVLASRFSVGQSRRA